MALNPVAIYKAIKKGSMGFIVATVILSIILIIVLLSTWNKGWTTGRKMAGVTLFLSLFMLYRWRNILRAIIFPEEVAGDIAAEKAALLAEKVITKVTEKTAEGLEIGTERLETFAEEITPP